ncbi:MAG: PadR family transcriptional regulator [Acidimicrobiia bacterium]|nr:MAG: PadR family transcriptional regulator [Acidimicrobiia bacterium]
MTEAEKDPHDLLPLPPAQLHILLALADGERHGYAVMSEVERMTDGEVSMGPGTLYGAIKRMLNAGLIEESDNRPDPELDDERRRYYRTKGFGARVLTAELSRLDQLIRAAQAKQVATRLRPGWEGAP